MEQSCLQTEISVTPAQLFWKLIRLHRGKYGLNVLFRGLMIAEDVLGREERHQLDFQIPGWLCKEGSKPICTCRWSLHRKPASPCRGKVRLKNILQCSYFVIVIKKEKKQGHLEQVQAVDPIMTTLLFAPLTHAALIQSPEDRSCTFPNSRRQTGLQKKGPQGQVSVKASLACQARRSRTD